MPRRPPARPATESLRCTLSVPIRRELCIAEFAAARHRLIRTSELEAFGLTSRATSQWVRRGRLRRIHRAVYLYGGGELTEDARLYAAALAIGEDAVLGHIAAAALGGFWPYHVPATVDVIVPRHVASRRGIRVHSVNELPPDSVTTVRGIPVTTPARTAIDLAATVRKEYAYRRAVHEGQAKGLLPFADYVDEFERAPLTVKGRARILAEIRAGATPTRSGFEDWTVELLRAGDFPPFITNAQPPGTPDWVEVDIFFPAEGLVIEVDGDRWHHTPWRQEHGAHKRAIVRQAGHPVLVLTDDDGQESRKRQTADRIHAALRDAHTLASR
jgi:predicted transcriptional regulator of viral defense system/very-short-patch-repair endonuclease